MSPASSQHACPPSITNALSIWGLAALMLAIGLSCHAPILLGCAR